MKIAKAKKTVAKKVFLWVGLVLFILGCEFLLLLSTIFIIPVPEQRLAQRNLKITGPVLYKDENYFVVEKKGCNASDCHMFTWQPVMKKEPFDDVFNVGDEVTVQIDSENRNTGAPAMLPNGIYYYNVYTHTKTDPGDTADLGIFGYFYLAVFFLIIPAAGYAWWKTQW